MCKWYVAGCGLYGRSPELEHSSKLLQFNPLMLQLHFHRGDPSLLQLAPKSRQSSHCGSVLILPAKPPAPFYGFHYPYANLKLYLVVWNPAYRSHKLGFSCIVDALLHSFWRWGIWKLCIFWPFNKKFETNFWLELWGRASVGLGFWASIFTGDPLNSTCGICRGLTVNSSLPNPSSSDNRSLLKSTAFLATQAIYLHSALDTVCPRPPWDGGESAVPFEEGVDSGTGTSELHSCLN